MHTFKNNRDHHTAVFERLKSKNCRRSSFSKVPSMLGSNVLLLALWVMSCIASLALGAMIMLFYCQHGRSTTRFDFLDKWFEQSRFFQWNTFSPPPLRRTRTPSPYSDGFIISSPSSPEPPPARRSSSHNFLDSPSPPSPWDFPSPSGNRSRPLYEPGALKRAKVRETLGNQRLGPLFYANGN